MNQQSVKEEIEIKNLFDVIIFFIKKFRSLFTQFFQLLISFLVQCFLFLKKNSLLIIIGGVIGVSYPSYNFLKNGDQYESSFTIEINYKQNEHLYNLINHYTNLLERGNRKDFLSELALKNNTFDNLSAITISPVITVLEQAGLYNQYLNKVDTSVYTPQTFEEYISQLKHKNYKTHRITISSSRTPIDYTIVQDALLKKIKDNDYTLNEQDMVMEKIKNEISANKKIQYDLDSLIKIENQAKLNLSKTSSTNTTNFVMADKTNPNTTEWIYQNYLTLQTKINSLKENEFIYSSPLRLLSPCSKGNKIAKSPTFIFYGSIGMLLSILIALLLLLNKNINKFENAS